MDILLWVFPVWILNVRFITASLTLTADVQASTNGYKVELKCTSDTDLNENNVIWRRNEQTVATFDEITATSCSTSSDSKTEYLYRCDPPRVFYLTIPSASSSENYVKWSCQDAFGNHNADKILQLNTPTAPPNETNEGIIAGAVGGGIVLTIIVVFTIVICKRCKSQGKDKTKKEIPGSALLEENENDEDELKVNILYESAGPNKAPDVTKTQTNPGGAAYAVVNKRKDKKEGWGDIYGQVDKKRSKSRMQNEKGTSLYENSDDVYANEQRRTGSRADGNGASVKIPNKGGLVYADVEFQKNGGSRKARSRPPDSTVYAVVDVTKLADQTPNEQDNIKT